MKKYNALVYQLDMFENLYERHQVNKKKLDALVNHSEVTNNFDALFAIECICRWMDRGFLDKEAEDFLDYLLKKNEVDYLTWCCRIPAIRRQMKATRRKIGIARFSKMKSQEAPQMSLPLKCKPYSYASV